MAVIERQTVITTKDKDGNTIMHFPVTSAKYVENAIRTVNGKEPDANGDVVAVGFESYWEAGETVEVGDVRLPKGRENSGIVWECIRAGTTGTEQPVFDVPTEIANFVALERIGHMRLIFNLAEKEADEILACGVTYSRATYPELWQYVQNKSTLLLTEEEWQAKYTETNGTFVPYYSSGNGSTTFRTPLLGGYLKGSASSAEIGAYKEAGLPNIEGQFMFGAGTEGGITTSGSFYDTGLLGGSYSAGHSNGAENPTVGFDASLSNPIYGNSDTVTPETMTGVWVIKAIGIVTDTGSTDLTSVLTGIEETAQRVSQVEDATNGMIDYVVESWREGTDWYRVYKSGRIEQGGEFVFTNTTATSKTITFLKPFPDDSYNVTRTHMSSGSDNTSLRMTGIVSKTATGISLYGTASSSPILWSASSY